MRTSFGILFALLPAVACTVFAASPPDDKQKEAFLREAKIVSRKPASKGIAGVTKAKMSDGTLTHDAALAYIDEYKPRFESFGGTEINFKDTWKFNVAAYKLDRLLGINMVPVTVERRQGGRTGSACWWVDNVQFDEADRMKQKVSPPDSDSWNQQMWVVRVFDQLIYNMDRNLGNLVIDKDWRIWMIDHTRAFRMYEDLKEVKNLDKIDRQLLANLKKLDEPTLKRELTPYLTGPEIKGILKRRDKIVAFFEQKGESALYDLAQRH